MYLSLASIDDMNRPGTLRKFTQIMYVLQGPPRRDMRECQHGTHYCRMIRLCNLLNLHTFIIYSYDTSSMLKTMLNPICFIIVEF